MRTAPAVCRSLAVGPEGRRHQDQEVSTHSGSACPNASRRCANNGLSKPPAAWPPTIGRTAAWYSQQHSGPRWTPRTSGVISAAPSAWCPASILGSDAARVTALFRLGAVRRRHPVEQIAQLVGHSSTTVTELVYWHQLRPVIQTGATVLDRLFAPGSGSAQSGS
jgi:hypothetical protein